MLSKLIGAAMVVAVAGTAQSQIVLDPAPNNIEGNTVCTEDGVLQISDSEDECDVGRTSVETITFGSSGDQIILDGTDGSADFSGAVNFNSTNVQFNSGTQSFSGTSTFNSTVSFVGPSVTFSAGTTFQNPTTFNGTTDFNAGMTTTNIDNSGTILTATLIGQSVQATNLGAVLGTFASGLTVFPGAAVSMGQNVIHNVGAGVAATDAVNLGQLTAATAGLTADVTALETLTDTHTTQIANIETVNAAQSTQIINLENTAATHTTQITNLQTGLTAESAARISADNALDTRVDTLEAITSNLDERFDNVADRSDAGTATAVALSGAMFLPGKTFNLTGNVGAYRGSVAGALQLGVVVSDMVAVNAGVAKGLNKHGKTAARVGFTLGW